MSEENMDVLYGNKGIDTPYERDVILYRPDLGYSKEKIKFLVRPEVQQSIERSRTFTISQNLIEYDELVKELDQMMKDIEARNPKDKMDEIKQYLKEKNFMDIMIFEKDNSSYNQTGDYELYTILHQMRDSAKIRHDFIDERFRAQLTDETDIDKVEEAEREAINEWEQLEAQISEAYLAIAELEEEDEYPNSSSVLSDIPTLTYELIEELEKEKRNKELFHTTLADTSYVHRNRYFMFLEVVERAKVLTYQSNQLIDFNLKEFMLRAKDIGDFSAPKSHLLLEFKKTREEHSSIKGRISTIDEEKESFASEKNYMYQQLETKTIEPLKHWLYGQEENISGSLDMFSQFMVDSMIESRKQYEGTLADMLNFYQSESDFYGQQLGYLKKKEEIRKFFSILTDLEDVEDIHGEWVEEYLKVNGYSV